jgi:hypothetical protein
MTFQTRWWLPMAMASSLVVACGSSGGGGGGGATVDAGTDTPVTSDITATDAPADRPADATTDRVTPPVDRAPPASPCSTAVDVSMRMPGADGSIRVTGSLSANEAGQIGDLSACMLPDDTKINATVFRYTMRAAGRLQVSTVNDGTDPMVDTIVAILPTCSATAAALACNDDVARNMLRSTATTPANLMAGQTVFIVVGAYGGMTPGDMKGDFELSIRETLPGGLSGPCRTMAPFCDAMLQCTAAMPTAAAPGTCVRAVAAGMPCTAMDTCVTGAACIANPGSMTMGTCRADGSSGGRCRVGMATTCDMGLACTAATPTAMATGLCRTSVAADAECDPTQVANACAAGTACRPSPTAMNLGRTVCVANGLRGGLCRTDSPRCDAMLECSSATPATCRASVAAAAECDITGNATFCATGTACALNAMLNGATCQANGAVGTPCRDGADAGARCDGDAVCSAATGAGVCRRTVATGMPCDLRFNSTVCASMGVCQGATGAATGTCAATVAETEPNDAHAMGNGPVTMNTIFRGALSSADDIDCFRVTVPANSSITATTGDATGACNLGMGADTTLQLNNPMGDEIATNDDVRMGVLCSELNATVMGTTMLPAGTYSVCVGAYMGTPAIPSYYLNVRIVTP